MRYEIHAVADAECRSYHSEVSYATDDLAEAQAAAGQQRYGGIYGCAIVDTQTGKADYGAGVMPMPAWGYITLPIYLTEDHLGGNATEADARRAVAILRDRGYPVHYGTGDGAEGIDWQQPDDESIPPGEWERLLEAL